MKSIKLALLGGAALAVSAAAAHADDLTALKAQIEALNARVAAMETAPSAPAGYQLLAVSAGELQQVPGADLPAREIAAFGNKATVITVMPTADAPAGATVSWSGYARAGVVYNSDKLDRELKVYDHSEDQTTTYKSNTDTTDQDVKARGQLRVVAKTDTAVGDVGVELKLRSDFNGSGTADLYGKVVWGYWAMTPELTLGGGYNSSLGKIGYGYDGACTCYYTDNADVAFNPGDTTQMRLTYGSGPISMAVALEDASSKSDASDGDKLGVAGKLKYKGDGMSGEIAAVWHDLEDNSAANIKDLWQVGAGMDMKIGSEASISLAAAYGKGPFKTVDSDTGNITSSYNYNQTWWGVSALASANLSDEIHAEVGAGYKNRKGDDFAAGSYESNGAKYDTWALLGGIYYQPVDQLTIGLETEYAQVKTSFNADKVNGDSIDASVNDDKLTVDLVSVWRF